MFGRIAIAALLWAGLVALASVVFSLPGLSFSEVVRTISNIGPLALLIFAFWVGFEVLEHIRRTQEAQARTLAAQAEAELAARRAESERLRALELARENHRNAQAALSAKMTKIAEAAALFYSLIPPQLLRAEQLLDQAEKHFAARAFSPFWDGIERTIDELGNISQNLASLDECARSFQSASSQYEGPLPQYPLAILDVQSLSEKTVSTSERLDAVVASTRSDFQFSTIYEQRKTTQVIVAGFRNLSEAIHGLGDKLSYAIRDVANSVRALERGQEARHEELLVSHRQTERVIEASLEASSSQIIASSEKMAAAAAAERRRLAAKQEEASSKQLAMLDNIQRHRRPREYERGPRKLDL